MSYQRSKAPLALMEQIIMILVFALASAVCLQAFVYSDSLSKQGEIRDAAVTYAQQMAEYCKAEDGDLDKVSEKLQADRESDGLSLSYPEDGLNLRLRVVSSETYLEKAEITVTDENGEEIYSLSIAWQKGGAA